MAVRTWPADVGSAWFCETVYQIDAGVLANGRRAWRAGTWRPLADGQVPTVGTKCMTTRRIGGASRPVTSRLSHIDPPRTWGVRGTDGPIRAAVDVLVEPVTGSRSRLTISVDFTGHGIGKVLVPLMVRREARKEMPENMARLKRLIEES